MHKKAIMKTVLLGLSLIGSIIATPVWAGDVYAIANPGVDLTEAELKDVYLGEKQFAGSVKLVPVDNAAVQSDFLEKVLSMEASKYGALWIKKGFRAGLAPPAIQPGDASVISFVKSTPGAVGYTGVPAQGVKLLHKY